MAVWIFKENVSYVAQSKWYIYWPKTQKYKHFIKSVDQIFLKFSIKVDIQKEIKLFSNFSAFLLICFCDSFSVRIRGPLLYYTYFLWEKLAHVT